MFYGKSIIYAKCRVQRQVATSSAAAGLHEIFQTSILELNVEVKTPTILTDSSSSVRTIEKSTQTLQKHLSRIGLKIVFIKREDNLADIQTR